MHQCHTSCGICVSCGKTSRFVYIAHILGALGMLVYIVSCR